MGRGSPEAGSLPALHIAPHVSEGIPYGFTSTAMVAFMRQQGVSLAFIGNFVAAAIACIADGWLGDRFGSKRIVALAYALTAAPTLVLGVQISAVGLQSVPLAWFYGLIVAHGLFFGMAYGVRNAIFMGMTNPAVAATQFTAFMGMANVAISIGNYWQGVVAERQGYAVVLYLDALFAVLVILVIPFLRDREARPARERLTAEPLLASE